MASTKKTALLSFIEFFCYLTEQSTPHAYFQFAYQDNGEIKYIKTKTTCNDLIGIGVSNDASKNPILLGERIKLDYKEGKPFQIKRENGDVYEIEESGPIRSFFTSKINIYENLKYLSLSSDQVINECLLIKESDQHDRCLSFLAGLRQDIGVCDKMALPSNQSLCEQWINNIKSGSVDH